jgi:hypothetical protein
MDSGDPVIIFMRIINLMMKYLDILSRVGLPFPGVIEIRSFKSYGR